jgi:O-antigen chain-terminating methyltransferase
MDNVSKKELSNKPMSEPVESFNAQLVKDQSVNELMSNIKLRVKGSAAKPVCSKTPHAVSLQMTALNELNKNWAYVSRTLDPESISSHRAFLGPIIVKLKQLLFSILRNNLLKPYFDAQEEFNANTVRCLNQLARGLIQGSTASVVGALPNSGMDYLGFENEFRGSEEEISKRLKVYPPFFKNLSAKVLEIGAGRGELQKLFKSEGIASYAIDTNPDMVDVALAKGLDVRLADGVEHLAGLRDNSLGGIVAVQVVEHLPLDYLQRLLNLAKEKLIPNGILIVETINTKSLLALAHNYHRDPTHQFPMHPDTLSFLVKSAGFEIEEVLKLSKFPDGVCFQMVEGKGSSPDLFEAVKKVNENFSRLNEFMFDNQDYAIVAKA